MTDQKSLLIILNLAEEEIQKVNDSLNTRLSESVGNDSLCSWSKCKRLLRSDGRGFVEDGRYSIQQKKFYTYHFIALQKFGKDKLLEVSTKKSEDGALTISHICGSRDSLCCVASHLVIEHKKINDERVHCHFMIRKGLESKEFLFSFPDFWKYCPHHPKCCGC